MEIEQLTTYTVTVDCLNCKKVYAVEIPKGKPIEQSECPVCGCKMLRVTK